MVALISASIPAKAHLVRIHASGDFYSQTYFDAWMQVARMHPSIVFYAYTKALVFWQKRMHAIPGNMRLVASYGGTHDHFIATYALKSALVVNYETEAHALGLTIDHDDTHAWQPGGSFALLIHGTQPAGTIQAKAWSVQRAAKRAAKLAAQVAHA